MSETLKKIDRVFLIFMLSPSDEMIPTKFYSAMWRCDRLRLVRGNSEGETVLTRRGKAVAKKLVSK